MGEVLVSATLLILVVMVLRRLSGGRIGMRFRYALWLMVALRLIVPVSFGSSPFSILNLSPQWANDTVNALGVARPGRYEDRIAEEMAEGTGAIEEGEAAGSKAAADNLQKGREDGGIGSLIPGDNKITGDGEGIGEIQDILQSDIRKSGQVRSLGVCLWIAGIMIVGGYMAVSQIRFVRYLHRMRIKVTEEELPKAWRSRLEARGMYVYLAAGLPSPCLVGRDIYIGPQILKEEDKLQHVLAHEYAHAVQGDRLWSYIRSALCAVYWFYPLVWLASYEAKKDSELACDERVIRILGESERFAYGRTLVSFLSVREEKGGYAGAVLIMGGKKNSIKERVFMIAEKKKTSAAAAVLVALAAAVTCGCAFTGAAAGQNSSGTGEVVLLVNEGSLTDKNTEETMAGQDGEEKWDAGFGQEEWEEGAVQQRADKRQREETERDREDVEMLGAEQAAFEEVLGRMEDSGLASAVPVDMEAYYNYLYEREECPLTDGQWYQLPQEEETGIDLYGLYTQEYGCRGLKIKIGDDVNTFDQSWLPTSFKIGLMVLEESKTDGLPRSFVFKTCIGNGRDSEVWRLYLADRYDTGTVELYCFESEDLWNQLKEKDVTFSIVQEAQKVELICDENVVGSVDIFRYADETVEEAVWDRGTVGYMLDERGDGRIKVLTAIGLKAAGKEEMLYNGLSLIACPVEIGSFGERSFTLGTPFVDEKYVNGRLNKT